MLNLDAARGANLHQVRRWPRFHR